MLKLKQSIRKAKYYILHFTFYIIITPILLLLLSCTSSTETQKGKLSGVVTLEDQDDHSGIIVSLYELAYLDTTITRINNQYPHIGVIINQHTEFDHRLQSPIMQTTTDAEGNFELEKIPTGTYNFVANKAGYGFKYLYEMEIAKGENLLSNYEFSMFNSQLKANNHAIQNSKLRIQNSDITLYSEHTLSGTITDDWIFQTGHHYIIEEHTEFHPSTYLEIQPGAVVRINPGKDLTIHSNLKAQGEENNMFWITSNDGFADEVKSELSEMEEKFHRSRMGNVKSTSHFSLLTSHTLRDSLALYNSMELSSVASVEDDLIKWGKWDWGNICLLNQVDNLFMKNSLFRISFCGYQVANVSQSYTENVVAYNCESDEHGGIYYYLVLAGGITKSIINNSGNGIKLKDKCDVLIKNNYLINNLFGVKLWQCLGNIEHNELSQNEKCDIGFTGNQEVEEENLNINCNNFYSNFGIMNEQLLGWAYYSYSLIFINYNNFYSQDYYIRLTHGPHSDIITNNNYFDGILNIQIIEEKINDYDDNNSLVDVIIINPSSKKNNSGIQIN